MGSFPFSATAHIRGATPSPAALGLVSSRPRNEPHAERFERGQTIVWDGDESHHVFQLVSGTVRHCRILRDGQRVIVGFGYPGDLFGFSAHDRYLFMTETVTECSVRRLAANGSLTGTDAALDDEPALRESLRLEFIEMQETILRFLHRSAEERVASFLLMTGNRLLRRLTNGERFELVMPRSDIADHLGLSVETVCRALSRLRRQGIVALEKRSVVMIRSVVGLRECAGANASDVDD